MRRILVVDDELQIRSLIDLALNQKGYPVDLASDGQQAVSYLQGAQTPYGLVITDINFPHRDALEQYLETHELPVIAMTGAMTDENKRLARRLHAREIVSKPFISLTHLLEVVGKHYNKENSD